MTLVLALVALAGGSALATFGDWPVPGITQSSVRFTITPDSDSFLPFGPAAPGDRAVRGITITNMGSVALRYAVTSISPDNELSSWLALTVWEQAAEGATDDDCGQQPPAHTLYGPGDPGSPAGTRLVGDPAQGFQEGDRTLLARASKKVCFMLAVPLSVGNAYQSSKASPEFRFDVEQTDEGNGDPEIYAK